MRLAATSATLAAVLGSSAAQAGFIQSVAVDGQDIGADAEPHWIDMGWVSHYSSTPLDLTLQIAPNDASEWQTIDLEVTNQSTDTWKGVVIEVGTGTGADFEPGGLGLFSLVYGFGPLASPLNFLSLGTHRLEFGDSNSVSPGDGAYVSFDVVAQDGPGGTPYEITLRFTPQIPSPAAGAFAMAGALALLMRRNASR